MVICKLERPSSNDKFVLELYCSPSMVSDIISKLSSDELLSCKVSFIKVIIDDN